MGFTFDDIKLNTDKWITKVLDKYQVVKKSKIFLYFGIYNSFSFGCFDWPFIIMGKIIRAGIFSNDKWNKFASYGSNNLVLHFYVIIFAKKYWYWILILQYVLNADTDTASVFFRLHTDTDTSVFQKRTEYWIIVLLFCTGQCSDIYCII